MSTRRCASGYCRKETTSLKHCNGCKKVWYCGTTCQKSHWFYHIFDCKIGQPIDTAYHLARSVHLGCMPDHPQTIKDYGFEKAILLSGDACQCLLYLWWREMIVERCVSPQDIRKWRREGRMIEGFKKLYESLPIADRGESYGWFLQHQYLFDGVPLDKGIEKSTARKYTERAYQETWEFIGGKGHISVDDMLLKISQLPPRQQNCFQLYQFLVPGSPPPMSSYLWLSFGFVAARHKHEEVMMAITYINVIEKCTFEEFSAAYESSSMPDFISRHGFITSPLFREIMTGSPNVFKSVWTLKHYLIQVANPTPQTIPPILAELARRDYGYFNCKKDSEWDLLNNLYMELFTKHGDGMDPLDLHAACRKGELLEYVKRFVKLSPNTAKFTRLLKNRFGTQHTRN